MNITALIPLVKGLVEGLFKLFTGLFLINHGKQKANLEGTKEEIKDAKEASKVKSNIERLPDSDLDSLL